MTHHIEVLIIALILLVLISAFFSGSETGMMSINRYRLRHLAREKNRPAERVTKLLLHPERLLGVILIGNTFANILASSLATVLAVHFFGDLGVAISAFVLTFIILIFAEIMPKTLAAHYSQKFAFTTSLPLSWLLNLLYPFVWLANLIVNNLLKLFGVKFRRHTVDRLTQEELRTVVHDAVGRITTGYQDMMLGILDLGEVTVNDIMVPRNEIEGIDIDDNWPTILEKLKKSQYTRLPVYRSGIENVQGVLHLRRALNLLAEKDLDKKSILGIIDKPEFILEETPLNVQLGNFRKTKERMGLVVDEYGDILGLVTLEDILEEIVGEFTTDFAASVARDVHLQPDGSYLVDGSVNVRDLNRTFGWELPVTGPKTISGLIVENLEFIPETPVGLRLAGYPIEIVEIKEKTIKSARIWPDLRIIPEEDEEI